MCSDKNIIKGYFSLSIAKKECEKDKNCGGIFDINCKKNLYWTCSGKMKEIYMINAYTYADTCAWEKGIYNRF